MTLIVGAHVSISKGFLAAAKKTALEYKANAMQIFLRNPRQANSRRDLSMTESEIFQKFCQKNGIAFLVAHSSYLINLAKKNPPLYMLNNLVEDLTRISQLGGMGVILHPGKKLNLSLAQSLKNLDYHLNTILEKTSHLKTLLILENTAGQGSEFGYELDTLNKIRQKSNFSSRIKFCFDTAHAFGAGIRLDEEKKVSLVFQKIDQILGIENLACIHLNDSKKEQGSHKDRHANLGEGLIGIPGLKKIIAEAIDKKIPLILETPGPHGPEIEKVKKWAQSLKVS